MVAVGGRAAGTAAGGEGGVRADVEAVAGRAGNGAPRRGEIGRVRRAGPDRGRRRRRRLVDRHADRLRRRAGAVRRGEGEGPRADVGQRRRIGQHARRGHEAVAGRSGLALERQPRRRIAARRHREGPRHARRRAQRARIRPERRRGRRRRRRHGGAGRRARGVGNGHRHVGRRVVGAAVNQREVRERAGGSGHDVGAPHRHDVGPAPRGRAQIHRQLPIVPAVRVERARPLGQVLRQGRIAPHGRAVHGKHQAAEVAARAVRNLDLRVVGRRRVGALQRIEDVAEIVLEIVGIHHDVAVAAERRGPGIGHQIIARAVAAHRHHVVDVVDRAGAAHPGGVARPPRVERGFRVDAARRHAAGIQPGLQRGDLGGAGVPVPQPHVVGRAPVQPLDEIRHRGQGGVVGVVGQLRQRRHAVAHEDLVGFVAVAAVVRARVREVVGELRRALVARLRQIQRGVHALHVRALGVVGARPVHAGPQAALVPDRRQIAAVVRRALQRFARRQVSRRRRRQGPPRGDPLVARPRRIRLLAQFVRAVRRHQPRQRSLRPRDQPGLRPGRRRNPRQRRHQNPPHRPCVHVPLQPV